MNIQEATASYESWVAERTGIVKADLELKHQRMRESAFPFFRATFYRWLQLWEEVCADMSDVPVLLAVGDLHVENFGTWRDGEGRLVWGINDFDEVSNFPYAMDLVRLVSSARLAIEEGHLAIHCREAGDAVLGGYTEGLASPSRPFVLAEHHTWLREAALSELRGPVHFWEKMEGFPDYRGDIPPDVRQALEELLPERGLSYRTKRRVAGLGSLGRTRIVALAEWRGGLVAREAKALVPSANVWAKRPQGSEKIWYGEIIERAARVPDPFLRLHDTWVLRRLAPDCSRIELSALPKKRDEARLLRAMGWETANVHLGNKDLIPAVQRDLKKRPADWLHDAAKQMVDAVMRDWESWRK